MILIISSEDDISTNDVIDWLRSKKQRFQRISSIDKITFLETRIENFSIIFKIEINKKIIELNELTSIWYRRSWIKLDWTYFKSKLEEGLNHDINNQLYAENVVLNDFLQDVISDNSLNKMTDNTLNKLCVLKLCNELRIKTPKTLITSQKKAIIEFKAGKTIITKNFTQGVFINYNEQILNGYTLIVDDKMIEKLEDKFYPMLIQEKFDKIYEVRAFYLNEEFYCMAILSQNDNKTKVDFRNYNYENPNRTPPYSLPNNLKIKLNKLMNVLKINSGSIDLMVNQKGEHVFLEVNPIGQFTQVSKPCNYYIEEKIAKSLIYNVHGRKTNT